MRANPKLRGLSYLSLVREAEDKLNEAKEASRMSLEIYEAITPRGFRTGLGLHRMSTFLHRDGELEQALYVILTCFVRDSDLI